MDEILRLPRNILRCCNGITSDRTDGIDYLEDVFQRFMKTIRIDPAMHPALEESLVGFVDAARARIEDNEYTLPVDVETLKKMFRYPSGVVVNTCHGVKGEEYTAVICFGMLHGYIPHWNRVFDETTDEREEARRILYVVASRARKHLHLFAESGRRTQSGRAYAATDELGEVEFEYDVLPV